MSGDSPASKRMYPSGWVIRYVFIGNGSVHVRSVRIISRRRRTFLLAGCVRWEGRIRTVPVSRMDTEMVIVGAGDVGILVLSWWLALEKRSNEDSRRRCLRLSDRMINVSLDYTDLGNRQYRPT